MSNPTSNFGWQMPTATDLVTDLPADFEVFGQAVDTDFVDLLGGTTGQILSKTSATDLDFTWIANDQGDITGVTAGNGISVTDPTGPVPTVAINTAVTADLTTAQTLTNKKLSDSTTTIVDVSDATKAIKFDVAGTTAVTGTIATAFTTAKIVTIPDTTGTVALTNGVINNTLTSTTGDIIYASAANTPARLGIGTTGQVVTVAAGIPSWATPASGAVAAGVGLNNNASQSISNGTLTAILFQAEAFDTDAYHNSTNTSRITIPAGKAGYYQINGNICFAGNATGQRQCNIYKNAGMLFSNTDNPNQSANITSVNISGIVYCAVADYLELYTYQSSGGALNVVNDSPGQLTYFSAILIGT